MTSPLPLATVAALCGLSVSETMFAPAMLTAFARSGNWTERSMLAELGTNAKLRDYFAESIRKVAASPEGVAEIAAFEAL